MGVDLLQNHQVRNNAYFTFLICGWISLCMVEIILYYDPVRPQLSELLWPTPAIKALGYVITDLLAVLLIYGCKTYHSIHKV